MVLIKPSHYDDDGVILRVGVQSNQFPRAPDIAAPLRTDGIEVAIGGFRVSGTMAMLSEPEPHVKKAMEMGVTLFAGEAEGRFDRVLKDAFDETLCHKVPNFIEKCKRAGVKRVSIGLENINPDSLLGASKRQDKLSITAKCF